MTIKWDFFNILNARLPRSNFKTFKTKSIWIQFTSFLKILKLGTTNFSIRTKCLLLWSVTIIKLEDGSKQSLASWKNFRYFCSKSFKSISYQLKDSHHRWLSILQPKIFGIEDLFIMCFIRKFCSLMWKSIKIVKISSHIIFLTSPFKCTFAKPKESFRSKCINAS